MQPLDILKLLRAHFYDRDVSCGLTGTVLLIQATNTSRSVVPQLQKCSEGNNCMLSVSVSLCLFILFILLFNFHM